jgi:hypothetical protein
MASRALPVLSRNLRAHDRGLLFHENLQPLPTGPLASDSATSAPYGISVDAVVAGRERKHP